MVRKLYVDMMSQPARALVLFCRASGIEVELVQTLISKGQNRTPEYRAINPLGKIPCLQEDDFTLGESAAILRYLATTNRVEDHWYPVEPRARARVDSAMAWHHGNIRRGTAPLCFHRVLARNMGQQTNDAAADEAELLLISALKMLEKFWLKHTSFVGGSKISIADVLMVTELDMLHVLDGAPVGRSMQELLAPFPKVREWMRAVAAATEPHYEEVNKLLMKATANFAKKKANLQSKL